MTACGVVNCSKNARSHAGDKKVCAMHYARWKSTGSFELVDRRLSCDGLCTAPGCKKAVRSGRGAFCETHYYRIRRASKLGLTPLAEHCERCGLEMSPGRVRFCSDRCSWRSHRTTVDTKACVVCGNSFTNRSAATICSLRCREARDASYKKAYEKEYRSRPSSIERFRNKELVRKARKNAAKSEEFKRTEIFERDGWKCGLCGRAIPKNVKWPHPKFGTIDHIVPLAKGGAHLRINVQAAHLRCNCSKNSRVVGQLRLFG